MNTIVKLFGIMILATVLFSPFKAYAQHYAEVLEVEPIYGTRTYYQDEEVEREVCRDGGRGSGWFERGTNSIFGSVEGLVGAAVGVAVGSQVGGGSGTEVAKVIGGIVGNKIGNNYAQNDETCRTEWVVRKVHHAEQYVQEYKYTVMHAGNIYHNIRRGVYVPVGEDIAIDVRVR